MTNGRCVLMLLENCPYLRDTRVLQEAQALTEAGYRVAVITASDGKQPRRAVVDGVHVYAYRQPSGEGLAGYVFEYGYAMVAALVLALYVWWEHGVDIVHAHNPPDTFFLIGALFKLAGKRFVFDHHDLAPELYRVRFGAERRWVLSLLLWLERLSCRCADLVIVANESHKRILMQRTSIPEERVIVVRNGPNLALIRRYAPATVPRRTVKQIGYIGEMAAQDGIDYLLRALVALRDRLGRTDWHCTLIGDGPALPALRELAEQWGLAAQVTFTGWLTPEQFIPILAATDVCVDPDPSNGYNDHSTMIKIMEYMALAKPVVAFDLAENRASADGAALYARANDELELARALSALLDDDERCRTMGELGRQRVESELAWRYQAHRLIEAYDKLNRRADRWVRTSA